VPTAGWPLLLPPLRVPRADALAVHFRLPDAAAPALQAPRLQAPRRA